ncbi:MAG: hypothetical protein CBB60_005330 [Armatimonadetes bacterium Cent15-Ar3]|nr:MAG: hypothetical protein CBB60_005330 [Armatimonadetes bacterium Cent15-Ar3]
MDEMSDELMDEESTSQAGASGGIPPRRRDWLGSLVGLAVFLGGIALIVMVFRLAYDMYRIPPKVALKIEPGKPLDVATTVNALADIVVKIVFLLFMAGSGSMVANRGIYLYSKSRGRH